MPSKAKTAPPAPTLAKPIRPVGINVIFRDTSTKPTRTKCFTLHGTDVDSAAELVKRLLAEHEAKSHVVPA